MTDLTTIVRRLVLWTIVCVVSAVPSFMWASQEFDRRAMTVGVALFILAYTALTSTAAFDRFHARPFVRRTLYIGYGARLAVSLVFPLGMGLDMLPGMLSVSLVEGLLGNQQRTFAGTLATTIVQGTLLNILLTIFMAAVYGTQKRFMQPPPTPRGFDVVMPVLSADPK